MEPALVYWGPVESGGIDARQRLGIRPVRLELICQTSNPTRFSAQTSTSPVIGKEPNSGAVTAGEARLCRRVKPPKPTGVPLTLGTVAWMSLTCIDASFLLLTHAGIRGAGRS